MTFGRLFDDVGPTERRSSFRAAAAYLLRLDPFGAGSSRDLTSMSFPALGRENYTQVVADLFLLFKR